MEPALVHGGECAASSLPTGEAVVRCRSADARFEAFDLRADRDNFASEVASEDEWEFQLRRRRPAADVNINWVYIHCANLDQAFSGPGFRRGQFAVSDYLWRTRAGNESS